MVAIWNKTLAARSVLGAIVMVMGLAAPAYADGNLAPPPEQYETSPGGVDMRSGKYVYSQTDMTIGGDNGLSLTRTLEQAVADHNSPFGNFSHNWEIMVSEKRIYIVQGIFKNSGGPDYQIEINFGGRSQTFRAYASTTYFDQISSSGYSRLVASGTLSNSTTVYTYYAPDGTVAVFRQIGSNDCSSTMRCAYVSQLTNPDGTVLDFEYDNSGSNATRLRSVTSNRGYALLFEYSGSVISKTCLLNLTSGVKPSSNACPTSGNAPTTSYTYTTSGGKTKLASATDPIGSVWGFGYGVATNSFTKPGQSTPWLVNTYDNRTNNDGQVDEIISSQAFVDGSNYAYTFDSAPTNYGEVPQIAGGSFTDNLNHTVTLTYDFPTKPYDPGQGHGDVPDEHDPDHPQGPIFNQITPGPVLVTDALGKQTAYDYCDPSMMANLPSNCDFRCQVMPMAVSTTDPEGIKTEMTWDMATRTLLQSKQIAKSGSGLANIVRSATYNCTPSTMKFCTKPLTVTDALGNVTTNTYDSNHGGVLTETGPTVGGVAPQKRYEYAQKYAWTKNSGGTYSQASSPVWVLTKEEFCKTSAASSGNCAAGPSDEVVTEYDYGTGDSTHPNNLLLRGTTVTADSTTLRTCFGYDGLGRKISETKPNANLTSCP